VTPSYSHIRTSIERHVAWIEFNRPPINAFNRAMVEETYSAVEAAIAGGRRAGTGTDISSAYRSHRDDILAAAARGVHTSRRWTR
jgi:enoyl-CoA hydratase/carnithine racemase